MLCGCSVVSVLDTRLEKRFFCGISKQMLNEFVLVCGLVIDSPFNDKCNTKKIYSQLI